jgi:phosphate-selective porin OprO/OprP
MMREFAIRGTDGNSPLVECEFGEKVGTYFSGSALNAQVGYLFKKNFELSLFYTTLHTNNSVGDDQLQYFIGFSRYVVGYKLKIQTDFGYDQVKGADDGFIWRLQVDFHE